MRGSNRNLSQLLTPNSKEMEKVFTTKSGVSLFVTYDGEDIKSFITDGKKEEIFKALREDCASFDFVARNMATMLLALTKKFGIEEQ